MPIAKRMFKKVTLFGLDFYVDWIDETGEIISIKEVHSGKRFVYQNLFNLAESISLEDMFRRECGIVKPVKEVEEEVKEDVAPAALETEQPKEETNGKKTKGRSRKVQK